ncbi:MAG TPA: hypothetical protein VJ725_10455 [Thermoanaerobaculia bacterium]|nr:hypothetical protein [Thermoanaerobaculia bacterium]
MSHLSQILLGRVLGGTASEAEVDRAESHLRGCRSCLRLAARVVASLSAQGKLAAAGNSGSAILERVRKEDESLYETLRARAQWAGLKEKTAAEQIEALRSRKSLQTWGLFSTLLEEAARQAAADPHSAEHVTNLALTLVDHLGARYAEELKNDFRGEAWTVIANCRRLGTDWKGAGAAIVAARNLLSAGTGDAQAEARLLSIQASLATDTGRVELTRGLLGRARQLYIQEEDWDGAARVLVKEASALRELFPEEALRQASEALRLLRDSDARLTMYAMSIVTEALITLRRIPEALRNFEETRPLYAQFPEPRIQLRVQFIEARLLDAGECIREAERLYSGFALSCFEAELYKESFTGRLALLDFYIRRERMDKAAETCREAVAAMEKLGIAHEQMRAVWRDLLRRVEQRQLDPDLMDTFRAYVLRHWNAPAARAPFPSSS